MLFPATWGREGYDRPLAGALEVKLEAIDAAVVTLRVQAASRPIAYAGSFTEEAVSSCRGLLEYEEVLSVLCDGLIWSLEH